MAYADPLTIQTLNTGDILTAAAMTQFRDNGEFLINPPACSVYYSTTVPVNSSTVTSLPADSENFDNDSMHSTVTNNTRITIQTTGRYLIHTTVDFGADIDGSRRVDFRINGGTSYQCMNIPSNSASSNVTITGLRAFVMGAGDYIEVRITHTAGNSIAVALLEFGATFITR